MLKGHFRPNTLSIYIAQIVCLDCLLFYNLYLKHVINIIDLTTLFINTNIKSVLLHGHFHNHGLLQIIENNSTEETI
jgi:hypothetical protein